MLMAEDLERSFGAVQAVRGISLSLTPGEIIGFLGRNGAGKTSTIEMLAGRAVPDQGSVTLDGAPVTEHMQRIGFLPEGAPLWPELTVRHTLQYAAGLADMTRRQAQQRVDEILAVAGLLDRANQRVGTLSKGLHRRVSLAFALMHDPEFLLLDEPFDGFDPVQRRAGRALLRELAQSKGILVCTHSLREAEALCDRVLVLHAGRIVGQGSVNEICRGRDFEDVFAEMTDEAA